LSTQAKVQKRDKCETKGWIRKGGKSGNKIIIIFDDATYFVTIKALKDIIDGTKEITPFFGY